MATRPLRNTDVMTPNPPHSIFQSGKVRSSQVNRSLPPSAQDSQIGRGLPTRSDCGRGRGSAAAEQGGGFQFVERAMGGDDNAVHLISASGMESWPTQSKDGVARQLVARIATELNGKAK